ncbi:MAG: hypothetical protein ACTSO9_06065 [Candidatus Helarchaeota archaeon]
MDEDTKKDKLKDEDKEKFVKEMMNLANKAKESSDEEIYKKINKRINLYDSYELIFVLITFLLAAIFIYLYYK